MSFRPAVDLDCERVWRWRLADELEPWYGGSGTTFGEHEVWWGRNRSRIKVWEQNGRPVGAVRVESDGSIHFMVHKHHREHALAMLRALKPLAGNFGGRLKVVVDYEDVWRYNVLVRAGFVEYPARFLALKPDGSEGK